MRFNPFILACGLLPLLATAMPASAPENALVARDAPTPVKAPSLTKRQDSSPTTDGPVAPTCWMSTALPSWQYAIVLDAHAPGVNTDCAGDYLNAMRNRGMDISTWWCAPKDVNMNDVALSDSSAWIVILTFWTIASSNTEINGAIWDASDDQYTTQCQNWDGGSVEKPDAPDVPPGESEPEEPEAEPEK